MRFVNQKTFTQPINVKLEYYAHYKAADLREIIKSISTIEDNEKNDLLRLSRKYEHLFDGTLGNFETSKVKLCLKEYAKPYHAKALPVPKNHHDTTLKHEIERLVKLGVLVIGSNSEWAAPTFVIPKKNGAVRFISDFRKLNETLKRMPYPIPKIAQIVEELKKIAYATSLDLNMGYYTIKLDADAKKMCTIFTPFGKYQYLRLPMGVSCSPDIFQEKMSDLMQHLNVKLLPLPQPPVRARTDARTNPSAWRATQLMSVLARVYAVSIQNQITTTVP
jgi:hypothetical protein